MAGLPLLTTALESEALRLRDFAERDIPEILIAYEDDPEMHRRLLQERPPSGAQLGRLAETEVADRAAGSRATLTILDPAGDLCLGQVAVHHLDREHARAELSLWVAPQARRRGLGCGALRLADRWLLDGCGIERVQLLVEPGNEPMLRTAARAGFVREGVLHGYMRAGPRRADMAVLSLLSSDPVPA
jgi:RimJ/RimL family protein N-acetyltransferase